MKNTLLNLSVASVIFLGACTNTPSKKQESTEVATEQNEQRLDGTGIEKVAEFVVKVADANMLEIELGRLAEKNGKMQDVKNFGKMMVNHHSKMLAELKTFAASKNISVPDGMSDDNRKTIEKFSNKAGHDFDKDYINQMVDTHKSAVKDFEDKSNDEKCDVDLRQWTTASLPMLRDHLVEINKIEEKFDAMKK
jgi:putative membrane protein